MSLPISARVARVLAISWPLLTSAWPHFKLPRNKDAAIAEATCEIQVETWCYKIVHLDFSQNWNIQEYILKDVIEIYFKTLEDVHDKLLNKILDYKNYAQCN